MTSSSASSTASWAASASVLPQNRAAASTPGDPQRVEGTVLALDGERALDEQQQAEQRGQPRPARAPPTRAACRRSPGGAGRRSRAKANITITIAANGQHLVERDPAAPLDAQVLAGDEPGGAQERHGATAVTWPATTSTVRVARDPARSSSWLATMTVAPDAAAWRSVASSSSRPAASSPAWGSSSSHSWARRATQAGQRGAPLLAGRQAAHRQRGEPAGEAEAVHGGGDLVVRGADGGAPEARRSRPPRGRGRARCGGRAGRPGGARHPGRASGRSRGPCRGRGPAAAARRTPAAASSCRRRWDRAAGRSRRRRR